MSATISEPVTASLSQFEYAVPSTSGNLPSIQNVIQMPEKAPNLKKRQGRKKQLETILSSTPINDALVKKENKNMSKAEKSKGKEVVKKSKPQKERVKKVKKKILQDSNDPSTSDVKMDDLCQDDEDDDAEGSNMTLVCGEFGRENEVWYRCTSCVLWAYADCTGWDSASKYVVVLITIVHMLITIANQC